jgi:hypothetical protein
VNSNNGPRTWIQATSSGRSWRGEEGKVLRGKALEDKFKEMARSSVYFYKDVEGLHKNNPRKTAKQLRSALVGKRDCAPGIDEREIQARLDWIVELG